MPAHTKKHRHRKRHLPFSLSNFLSFLEGIESGFATTSGILLGLWFQAPSRHLLAITAVVSLMINAVNNASVKFASEHTLDELDGREKRKVFLNALSPALLQMLTHVVMSVVVLIPVLVVNTLIYGIFISIGMTLAVLFMAGVYRGYTLRSRPLRDGLEVCLLGLLIIAAGGIAGWMLSL